MSDGQIFSQIVKKSYESGQSVLRASKAFSKKLCLPCSGKRATAR